MLVEFRVTNFRSIKDTQVFSMVASSDRSLTDNTIESEALGKLRLNRSAVVYGANASGKSNLIAALEFMRDFVLSPLSGRTIRELRDAESFVPVVPFLLDPATREEPSEFELVFIQRGVRYQYGFQADRRCVRSEWLIAYPYGQPQRWFERTLTYDNALLPLALFNAYAITGDRSSLRVARESLEFLEEICFADGQLRLVGNAGWHGRGGKRAEADEQPTDALALVLAFRGAYRVTDDRHYLQRMRESFAWFLGANRLGLPLYDFSTTGCHDGLGVAEVNRNQGAESTLSFLLALLEMLEVSGERPD